MSEMKSIPNFPNYCITKDGRVWSHISDKWLKPDIKSSGHTYVILQLNKKEYHRYIHRLMLETHVGPCPIGMECRHLDGNPGNNKLSNLKWGTRSENMKDAIKHGTHKSPGIKGEKHGMSKFTEQDVRMIIYMYNTKLFTQKEISEVYDVHEDTIWSIVNKKTWKHIWVA